MVSSEYEKSRLVNRRHFVFPALLTAYAFFVFAFLIGNTAGSLAGRLAGGLAFAAAAVFHAAVNIAGDDSFDSFHSNSPFYIKLLYSAVPV